MCPTVATNDKGSRQGWCGVGVVIVSTPDSFVVVAVLDARCVDRLHVDSPPIQVDDEVRLMPTKTDTMLRTLNTDRGDESNEESYASLFLKYFL